MLDLKRSSRLLYLVIYIVCSAKLSFSQSIEYKDYEIIISFNDLFFEIPIAGGGSKFIDDFDIVEDRFIFVDQEDHQIKMYNREFQLDRTIPIDSSIYDEHIYIKSNKKYTCFGMHKPYIYTLDNSNKNYKLPYTEGYKGYGNLEIINNIIIGQTNSHLYFSYVIPEDSNSELLFMNQEETFNFLSKTSGFSVIGDAIFYNDTLVGKSGKTLLSFNKKLSDDNWFRKFKDYDSLLGNDKDGNYYLTNGAYFFVLDSSFNLITEFMTKRKYPYTRPKVDADGNLYYCHLNEENNTIDLYMIERTW